MRLFHNTFTVWVIALLFIFLPLFFFRNYFFKGQVPFSANLLVSYYAPWKDFKFPGYEAVPNKPIGFDNVRLFYPNLRLSLSELKQGRLPLWNPYIFSGNPHLATAQTAVFYPLNLIYFFFPTIDGWSILVIIQPILAAWFLYLFLRSLDLSRPASVFGAIAYAYSGWMIAWWEESLVIEHSILWLSLALWAVTMYWKEKTGNRFLAVFVIALICSIVAGFFQMTIYFLLTASLWNAYLAFREPHRSVRIKKIVILVAGMVLAGLVTSIQWLPVLEAYMNSPRATSDAKYLFEAYLVPWQHLFTLIAPDYWGNPGSYNYFFPKAFYHEKILYIGIFPLLFFLYALLTKNRGHRGFWKVFTLVTISLGLQLPTSWVWYVLHVPMLASAQPSRIFAIATLGMSILAAYGVDHFRKVGNKKMMIVILLLVSAVLSMGWGYVGVIWLRTHYGDVMKYCYPAIRSMCNQFYAGKAPEFAGYVLTTSLRNLFLPTALVVSAWLVMLFFWKRTSMLIGLALLATILGSAYFAQKFVYFSDRQFVFPAIPPIVKLQELAGVSRVWGYGNAYAENNLLSYFGLYSPEGYSPFFSTRYGELLGVIRTSGRVTDQINRADVDLSPIYEDQPASGNPYRTRILSLLGVGFIMEEKTGLRKELMKTEARFPSGEFALVWEDEQWRIWKYKNALPRTFFTSEYEVIQDKEAGIRRLFEENFPYDRRLILEEEPFPGQPTDVSHGAATIARYDPNALEITVDAPRGGLVFLSDVYYPGWQATVDGKPAKIFRADVALRAVPVPAGTHVVGMYYWPVSVQVGIVLSSMSLVLGLLWIIRSGWRR